ncbi:MAG: hypothetical protein J6I49_00770 [Bacteroidales bacterium]|nr:hypothetical protein [Bacteroidales bacterium]
MNKTFKTLLCLATISLGIGTAAQAQDRKFYQTFYLDLCMPTADFGSKVSSSHPTVPLYYTEIGKDASVGFGLGYRLSYRLDVGLGEVAPFGNVDILWNTIKGKWRDKYSDAYMSTPTYFNIPFLLGVTYIYDELPWPDIRAYGEFGIGPDFLWITPEGDDGKLVPKIAYKLDVALGWTIGLGAYFGRYFSAGINYYGLGKHDIDYTKNTLEDLEYTSNPPRERRTVVSVMLRLGFHF